jgi:hypothetical protein
MFVPSGKGQPVLSQATARSVTCCLTAWDKVLERSLSTQRILTVTKLHPTPTSHHVPLSSVTLNPRLGLPFSSVNQHSLYISCLHCVRKMFQPSVHFITNDIDERRLRKRILFERKRLEGIFESKKNAVSYLFVVYLTTFSKCIAYIAFYLKPSCRLPSPISHMIGA